MCRATEKLEVAEYELLKFPVPIVLWWLGEH